MVVMPSSLVVGMDGLGILERRSGATYLIWLLKLFLRCNFHLIGVGEYVGAGII